MSQNNREISCNCISLLSFKSFWLHFAEYLLKALELFCKFDVLLLHVSV